MIMPNNDDLEAALDSAEEEDEEKEEGEENEGNDELEGFDIGDSEE